MRGKKLWVIAACLAVASHASAGEPAKPAPVAPVAPIASVSSVEGPVDVSGVGAKYGSVIPPGSPVTTGADAHVDVIFKDTFRVQLAPKTTFYVFGKPLAKGAKKPATSDCTLVEGSLRIVTTAAADIATPAGKVTFAPGTEAKVHVEAGVTRVSVHKGKATLGKTVVDAGLGVKVDKGASSGKATKLLDPPKWTAPPQPVITTAKETAPISAMLGGTAVSKWHIEVAVDDTFTTFVMDQQANASGPTLVFEQTLPVGKYWFRVSALGSNGLESTWTTVSPVAITKTVVVAAKVPEKPAPKKK